MNKLFKGRLLYCLTTLIVVLFVSFSIITVAVENRNSGISSIISKLENYSPTVFILNRLTRQVFNVTAVDDIEVPVSGSGADTANRPVPVIFSIIYAVSALNDRLMFLLAAVSGFCIYLTGIFTGCLKSRAGSVLEINRSYLQGIYDFIDPVSKSLKRRIHVYGYIPDSMRIGDVIPARFEPALSDLFNQVRVFFMPVQETEYVYGGCMR
ncbi:hypothetical protein ACFLTD_02150 [Elusimicrobiota bacterium]